MPSTGFVFGLPHLYHRDYDFDPEGLPGTPARHRQCHFRLSGGAVCAPARRGRLVAMRYLTVGLVLFAAALVWNPFFPIRQEAVDPPALFCSPSASTWSCWRD
jgi:predicted acyltransferase